MAGALRLTFEWSDGTIVLQDVQRVAKRAPVGDPPQRQAAERAVGMWLELLEDDRLAYRRQVAPMFPDSYEIPTGNPEQPFTNTPRRRPYQVQILVPAPTTGGRVVLRERRADPDQRDAAPREVVHVDVTLDDGGRPSAGSC